MYREEDCGCGQHGNPHGQHYEDRHKGQSGDCGCGGHEHHGHHGPGMNREWNYGGCSCGYHHLGDTRFHRHFISSEEMINKLEEYLKQLQGEAKGVEERIAEIKKKGESQPT